MLLWILIIIQKALCVCRVLSFYIFFVVPSTVADIKSLLFCLIDARSSFNNWMCKKVEQHDSKAPKYVSHMSFLVTAGS